MALSIFELNLGKKPSGNKISTGTLTTVQSDLTTGNYLSTGLTSVVGISIVPVGLGNLAKVSVIANSGGYVTISVVNTVGAQLTLVYTCACIFTGY